MPSAISITTPIQVPFGKPNEWNVWIKDPTLGETNFSGYITEHITTKRINKLWFSDISMIGVDSDEKNFIKKGNVIKIFSENKLWFKGRIVKVEYGTDTSARIKASGMASKLIDRNTDTTYTNTATSTIVTAFIADESTLVEGVNENYGNVSINIDDQNNLQSLSDLANTVEFEWYESQDTYPYDIDKINFASRKGSSTSVFSFQSTGANANSTLSSKEDDVERFANSINILGYGDGVNQIKASTFHATNSRTKLTADMTSTDTSMTVDDTSSFPAAGDVWVGQEKITYTAKTATTFTGLTRAVAFMGNVTQAYKHDTGIEVYDAQYTEAAPESGSSIEANGLKKGQTINAPSIIDQNYADRFGQGILSRIKEPLERIIIGAGDPFEVLNVVRLGDKVTATDTDADISGDHDVVGLVGGFTPNRGDFLDVELSNKRISLIDEIEDIQQTATKTAQFMQGATNIYTASNYENCDDSTPLSMRFYVPAEAVAINKVTLKFITKKFRAYSTSNANESTHTHGIPSLTVNASTTTSSTSGSESSHTHQGTLDNATSGSTVRHPGASSANLQVSGGGQFGVDFSTVSHDHTIPSLTVNASTTASSTSNAGSAHTHGINYAITEDTFPTGSPTIKVEVGEDGQSLTEVSGSPFAATDGGAHSVDITDEVKDVGADKWIEVKFTPQSGSSHNRVRIEGNAIIQIFIDSTT